MSAEHLGSYSGEAAKLARQVALVAEATPEGDVAKRKTVLRN